MCRVQWQCLREGMPGVIILNGSAEVETGLSVSCVDLRMSCQPNCWLHVATEILDIGKRCFNLV